VYGDGAVVPNEVYPVVELIWLKITPEKFTQVGQPSEATV
jgi:hypothetical protein